uniref:Rho-GAP domain-containing protein n=1 Tax=Romanomermis culicivorax TaxID=13658 RepID=A0A915K060_ROMCU
MASLIKSFFRELNEPLLTFDLYENFLSVAEVEDEKERLRCIYAMIELLPKANRNVFDRLMYHLARVAHHSEVNRMSTPQKEFEKARQIFVEQLNFLDKEKDKLIDELPTVPPLASCEEDNLTNSSGDELESPSRIVDVKSTLDFRIDDELAVDFRIPPTFSTLKHFTAHRVHRPLGQRLPSKYAQFCATTIQILRFR